MVRFGQAHLVSARKFDDGKRKVARVGGEQAGRTDVPSDGSGDDTKCAASCLNCRDSSELGDKQEHKRNVEEEEQCYQAN